MTISYQNDGSVLLQDEYDMARSERVPGPRNSSKQLSAIEAFHSKMDREEDEK